MHDDGASDIVVALAEVVILLNPIIVANICIGGMIAMLGQPFDCLLYSWISVKSRRGAT